MNTSFTLELQSLQTVNSDEEARSKGFPNGGSFKVLEHDFILVKSH